MNKGRIIADPADPRGIEFRGGNLAMYLSTAPAAIVSGPGDTGKTFACCAKLHTACVKYPGSQHSMMRKTYASMAGSVVQTFNRIVKGWPVKIHGSGTPTRYTYSNGSTVWLGGLDNPERALSSERDSIYVNQAEEISQKDWETISTRCTGRAAVVRHPQLFGDCNPSGSRHWIKELAKTGALQLIAATHKDNPTIYDKWGRVLPGAQRRLDALSKLTGVRRKRLFEGIWATAEGAVYDNFDANVHVMVREREAMRRFFLALDEGFTNPAVILVVGEDGDGRWHVFREFYQSGVLQESIVKTTLAWQREFQAETVAVDEAAAGLIADLNACGCYARGGKGRVVDGINRIQNRLEVAGDGRPRLTFDPSCVNCVNEMESYCWIPEKPKDTPKKEHDHCCFIAGTLVESKRGAVAIESLTKRDEVWTPFGWSAVIAAKSTGVSWVKDYGLLTATPSHPVFTGRGLIAIDTMSFLDTISLCKLKSQLCSKAKLTRGISNLKLIESEFISALETRRKEVLGSIYTKRCGSRKTESFQMEGTSIIATLTPGTTQSKISNVSHRLSTLPDTNRRGAGRKATWMQSDHFPQLGTKQKQGASGMPQMRSLNGQRKASLKSRANGAEISSRLSITLAASAGLCVNTEIGWQAREVFNLATEHGCFYANGILVSNSDALRYLDNVESEPTGAWDGRAVAAASTGWQLPAGESNLDPIDFVDATEE